MHIDFSSQMLNFTLIAASIKFDSVLGISPMLIELAGVFVVLGHLI